LRLGGGETLHQIDGSFAWPRRLIDFGGERDVRHT
jgi:hypothetical protein